MPKSNIPAAMRPLKLHDDTKHPLWADVDPLRKID
jgi:hypothetical protein